MSNFPDDVSLLGQEDVIDNNLDSIKPPEVNDYEFPVDLNEVEKNVNIPKETFFTKFFNKFKGKKVAADNDDMSVMTSATFNTNASVGSYGSLFELGTSNDPPMPNIGKPVDIEFLMDRNIYARKSFRQMMKVIVKDANNSTTIASAIPTSNDMERVVVTKDVTDMMREKTTKKQNREFVSDNLLIIEKSLAFRKAAIMMMNINYSKVMIRKIDPINLLEARTVALQQDNIAPIPLDGVRHNTVDN